jgi:NAD(P)-dependent dehydrogenase (short-subunit alcohol dehydrogenase family)
MNVERGEELARELGGAFARTDVSDAESAAAGFKAIRERIGVERILVCCAGIGPAARLVGRKGPHDAGLFARIIAINLTGTFLAARAAAEAMAALPPLAPDSERGVIVMTASVAAFDGQIGQIAYAASKGGVAALTLPMARELAGSGIRVMTIAPGLFSTPMLEALPADAQASLGGQVPFPPRLGKPAEFADLVAHIVGNTMLNGEVIRLDGAIRMAPR